VSDLVIHRSPTAGTARVAHAPAGPPDAGGTWVDTVCGVGVAYPISAGSHTGRRGCLVCRYLNVEQRLSEPEGRATVAARVLVIVAKFANVEPAFGPQPALSDAVVLEFHIRGLADEAEGRGDVCPALARACLLEDYMRIKRGEQWMAFDGEPEDPKEGT
jgi:hypothetical protein